MEKIKVYSHPRQNQPSSIDNPDIIKRYKTHLKNRGHTDFTRQSYLSALKHFLFWVENSPHYFKPISRASIKMFIGRHLPGCRCPEPVYKNLIIVRTALNQMLSMQGYERVRTISNKSPTASELDIEIDLFDEYLKKSCHGLIGL